MKVEIAEYVRGESVPLHGIYAFQNYSAPVIRGSLEMGQLDRRSHKAGWLLSAYISCINLQYLLSILRCGVATLFYSRVSVKFPLCPLIKAQRDGSKI